MHGDHVGQMHNPLRRMALQAQLDFMCYLQGPPLSKSNGWSAFLILISSYISWCAPTFGQKVLHFL